LLFEDSVGRLAWQRPDNYFHELVGSHFSFFYHVKETIPNDCPAEKIFYIVDAMHEEVQ
jgi:hypothetical protein